MKSKLIIFIFYSLIILSCSYEHCIDGIKNGVLPYVFKGVVDSTYIDNMDHASRIVILKNKNKIYLTYYTIDCFENIEKGDAIEKMKDSLYIVVLKKKNKFIYYPICNGIEIHSIPQ